MASHQFVDALGKAAQRALAIFSRRVHCSRNPSLRSDFTGIAVKAPRTSHEPAPAPVTNPRARAVSLASNCWGWWAARMSGYRALGRMR